MRTTTAILKRDIEAQLSRCAPSALSPQLQPTVRLHATGSEQLDRLLDGGVPVGSICELTGQVGSGRTSIAHSLLSVASSEAACAYIDPSGVFSPHSAAAAGVVLTNLLWVRFEAATPAQNSAGLKTPAVAIVREDGRSIHTGCGTSHPRGETKGLAPALEQMLFDKDERRKRKVEGTPGHPNQPLGLHTASREQVDWERFNLRHTDDADPLRQMDKRAAEAARARCVSVSSTSPVQAKQKGTWGLLDRVLRATDQVLHSGGFRVVVLDLGAVAVEQVLRVPSATWFRFRRAAQESDAILLLLTREASARSSAACVLSCSVHEPAVMGGVFQTASRHVEIARQRVGYASGKKMPGRAACWVGKPHSVRVREG